MSRPIVDTSSRPSPSGRGAALRERPLLPWWGALLASVAGGLLLDTAFPHLSVWPLSLVAVALALAGLHGRRVSTALLVGAVFGVSFYLPHIAWAESFLGDVAGAWVPWIALVAAESLLLAVLSPLITLAYRWIPIVSTRTAVVRVLLPVVVAMLWTLREQVLGNWPYGGFAWGRLGMAASGSPLAEAASWISVTGLTFGMALIGALAVEAVRHLRDRDRLRGWRVLSPWAAPSVVLVLLLAVPAFPTSVTGTMTIGAVQGDGPVAYRDARGPGEILQSQLDATAPLVGVDLDLLVWPEGGVDSDPLAATATARALDRVVREVGAPLLMNAASARGGDPTDAGTPIYNTSMLWTADGAVASHAKRNPVPFGEYVPDRAFYEAIVPELIGMIQREYTPGDDPPLVDVAGVGVGLAICFDVIDDALIREAIGAGAETFVFQTNNGDFRGSDENLQQLAFARMRAVETGRAVVNLSTTGTSQVIDANGETLVSLPVDTAGYLRAEVPLRQGVTAGVVLGPAVGWMMLSGLGVLGVAGVLAHRRGRA